MELTSKTCMSKFGKRDRNLCTNKRIVFYKCNIYHYNKNIKELRDHQKIIIIIIIITTTINH